MTETQQLNWKTRFLILFLTLLAGISSLIVNQIMIKSPSTINEEDPVFYNYNGAQFFYNNNTMVDSTEQMLYIQNTKINQTHVNTSILINNEIQGHFLVNPNNGTVYQNGKCKGNYSIWWVHVPNPMLTFGQGLELGAKFSVIDPTGFIDDPWENYTMIVDEKVVWWPHEQKFSKILGAQASFVVSIYSNDSKAASATLDLTVGFVELWDGGSGSNARQTLALKETDYPISRNRLTFFPAAILSGVIIIVIAYIFMKIDWKTKLLRRLHLNDEKRLNTTLLLIAGLLAVMIEYIDIWFYNPLGLTGNLLLHAGYLGFLLVICFIQKKHFGWTLPALLEIFFVLAMVFFVGDPYVPHLTAFMGSTVSWITLVLVSGLKSNWDEGKTKIGKILSKLI
ncbi:MAG: hypothetical protein GF329_10760 [Candidatus Lokiarchaeota archaeon]|nr:hypothetical protein [Candidatus Lokiarchaeota archaeon]